MLLPDGITWSGPDTDLLQRRYLNRSHPSGRMQCPWCFHSPTLFGLGKMAWSVQQALVVDALAAVVSRLISGVIFDCV